MGKDSDTAATADAPSRPTQNVSIGWYKGLEDVRGNDESGERHKRSEDRALRRILCPRSARDDSRHEWPGPGPELNSGCYRSEERGF